MVDFRIIRITPASDPVRPPSDKMYYIPYGCITHITGTDTNLRIRRVATVAEFYWNIVIASAEATGTYPIFSIEPQLYSSQMTNLIFDAQLEMLMATGNPNSSSQIVYCEFHRENFTIPFSSETGLGVLQIPQVRRRRIVIPEYKRIRVPKGVR